MTGREKKFVKWGGLAVGVLFVWGLIGVGLDVGVAVAWMLLTGWWVVLGRGLEGAEFSWGVAFGVLAGIVVAGFLVHRVCRWSAGSWTGKRSAVLVVGVLALFGTAVCGAGIVHQMAWLGRGEFFRSPSRVAVSKEANKAHQLAFALRLYAEAHEGRYPERLEEALVWEGTAGLWELGLTQLRENEVGEPVMYYGAGKVIGDPEVTVLVASGRAVDGKKRVVGWSDGSAGAVREEEWREIMLREGE